MRLVDQHVKGLMEDCKKRARDFGLKFDDETLEYIVSNQDMVELSPKAMIPTHYDFWMHDVEVLYGRGVYKLYPHNPYETVINTRPSISFYNNDNPDWMNKAIFYHVLAHQDFFQNNEFFSHTWNDDLCGRALSQKRRINDIRKGLGEDKRYVDYVIEFTRQLDNLVNIHAKLREQDMSKKKKEKLDYYFSDFLKFKELTSHEYLREIESYNSLVRERNEQSAKVSFLNDVKTKYPEFESFYQSYLEEDRTKDEDLIDFICNNSPRINRFENQWIKEVMQIVKNMSMYLEPQKYTKILNEGWATFIHNKLFLEDEHLNSHESDFAKFNANITQTPKIGMNPYAFGYQLLEYIEELGDKGKLNYDFQKVKDIIKRGEFDRNKNSGMEVLFNIRRRLNDFLLVNFLDRDNFQDFVSKNKLYVADRRLNIEKMKWEFYIKSRNGEDYRNMVIDKLPHPPNIHYYQDRYNILNLNHKDEGKQLYEPFIENVLRGISYLWKEGVILHTIEFETENEFDFYRWLQGEEIDFVKKKVSYGLGNFDKPITKKDYGKVD